jgi:hypothetical protein
MVNLPQSDSRSTPVAIDSLVYMSDLSRYEISQTFEKVFGEGSLDHDTGRVRMVYASWGLENNFQTYYNDTLVWLQSEYGHTRYDTTRHNLMFG